MRDLERKLEKLYSRHAAGIKYDLDVITKLCQLLGNPQDDFRSVHITGTNGKGSVCAFLESMLRVHGFKTGLYTSPHLVKFNERIKINGEDISDEMIEWIFDECMKAVNIVEKELRTVTFFEFATAMGFKAFSLAGVDIAVVEVGMGGRLDATNIINPLVSIITTVDYDHMQYLGNTLKDIAREKAGIIKKGVPVVTGRLSGEALSVIKEHAVSNNSTLIESHLNGCIRWVRKEISGWEVEIETQSYNYGRMKMPLLGSHQLMNLLISVTAFEILGERINIEPDTDKVKFAVENTRWPGRFELLNETPPVVIDCAHNPEGIKALVNTLDEVFPHRSIIFLTGMCADKDIKSSMEILSKKARNIIIVKIPNCDRSASPETIKTIFDSIRFNNYTTFNSLSDALREGIKMVESMKAVLCITGSIFLVGEFLKIWANSKEQFFRR